MKWYQLDVEKVEQKLHVTSSKGLSSKQVNERRKQYGTNELKSKKQVPKWLVFLKQFQDFMVLVLLAATLIAGLLGEYVDAIAIMFIVLVNGFIGYFPENKAEKSMEKLRELSSPMANVLRDGRWEKIPSKDVVVGDVVRIKSGDRIPADIRVVKSSSMETEESALTGESLPVMKHALAINRDHLDAQDQANMGFMGTLVTRGSGIGIVVGTGMNTIMGQIASLMENTKKVLTPLERRLAELGKILIAVALLLPALVVVLGVMQGNPTYEMFLAGVSLAVAAIPEGLPAIVTVALSLGVQRMIKKKAIVRKLSAVETLGTASVICSDKTGTMTENQMTVKEIYLNDKHLYVTGDGYDVRGEFFLNNQKVDRDYPNIESMLLYGMLCNNSNLLIKKGKYIIDGDPTDGAILVAARKMGIKEMEREKYTVIKELPFDSDRKRMSVVIEDDNGLRFVITKGAPDILLPRSSYIMDGTNRALLRKEEKENIEQAIERMANKALRTIAIGIRPLKKDDSLNEAFLERDLTFIGLFGMIDPPRKEVKSAIEECRQAGIKTVMITGDHVNTARAIAKQLNLLPENGRVIQGSELNQMSQSDLVDVIEDTC